MSGFNLSQWALRHPALIVFAMIVSLVLGVGAYERLGRAEDPTFTIKTMVVAVTWPGADARQMEQQVVDEIERVVQEVPHFDYVTSYSKPGEATLFIWLKDNTPPSAVGESWYQVRKRVGDARGRLPAGVQGPFFNDDFGDTFGSIYAFHSDGFDDGQMKQVLLAARQRLLRVADVAKIDLWGVQDEKIYVEFSPARLAEFGLAPQDIFSALQSQNIVTPAGRLESAGDAIYARVDGAVSSTAAIADVTVAAGDRMFKLGDVATVRRGFADPPSFSMHRDGQRVTALAVSMIAGGNILDVGAGLDAAIAEIQAGLPVGIEIEKISDQPTVVGHSVEEFLEHFVMALVIVLGVSFLALGWRSGIIVALSVPLVLAITFVIMETLGIGLHRISLGALIIALGLLVDDAIIAVEMIMVKLEEGWSRFDAASYAWTSTAFPMLTGTLITAAGFVPIGFAKSATSEYTGAIFWVVGIALIVSWLVAVIFTPYLGYRFLPLPKATADGHADSVYDGKFYVAFRRLIEWSVARRKLVLALAAGIFVSSLIAFPLVSQQFFPSSSREEVMIDLQLAEGSTYAATVAQAEAIEAIVVKDVRVKHVTRYVGGGGPRFFLALNPELPNSNFAQFVVYPHDPADTPGLSLDLAAVLDAAIPDARIRVARLENGPPVGYPVQFRVMGRDTETVRDIAGKVRDVMRLNPNLRDVNLQWYERTKAMRIVVDQDRARAAGLSTQAVAEALQSLLSGFTVTQLREGTEQIDVVARADASTRAGAERLADLSIRTPSGLAVPLAQVASVEPGIEEGLIWRRNREPALSIRADTVGRAQGPDISAQVDAALADIRKAMPAGYKIEVGGAVEESARGSAAIVVVFPIMFVLWISFLMLQLQSFSRVVMVLLTAPLGLIGVTFALLFTGTPFGFVAQLGVIALAGMIMRNAVILVDQIDQDIAAGHPRWTAIVDATVRRTRPVVLTALAAILAMVPLTLSAFWAPVAIAIMGGLAVATALTLFFTPALYAAWFRVRRDEPLAQPAAAMGE